MQDSMNNQSIAPSAANSSSTLPPEILIQHESIFINTSINYATVALILYEYTAHFPAEVAFYWRRKITGASVLFFANRYLVLVYSVALLRGAAPFTKLSCVPWSNGVRALEILSYLPWAAFSALRVYALRGNARGWLLGPFVFLLSIVPVCINFIDFGWASLVLDPLWGCTEAILESPELSIKLTIISRASLVLADLTVVVRAWMYLYKVYKVENCLNVYRDTLSAVFLRNGTIYFVILALLNLLHLAFCASSVFQSAAHSHVSDVVAVIEPLTSILVSRFLLSLQKAFSRSYSRTDSARASSISMHFAAAVVGSIGFVSTSPGGHDKGSGGWYEDEDEDKGAPPAYGWPGEDPFRDTDAEAAAASSRRSSLPEMSFRPGPAPSFSPA